MLATSELHQRQRSHSASFSVTARQLAEFLQSVEAEEKLLSQRLSDLESKQIRLVLANGRNEEESVPMQGYSSEMVSESAGLEVSETASIEIYGAF